MTDTRCISVVNNSYVKLKTYSITFINCLDRVVLWKLDEKCKSWKRFEALWMGIAWRNMEDGWKGLKHSSQNVTCFSEICFEGLGCPSIETRIGLLAKTWHVSMGGRFRGSCFMACNFRLTKTSVGPPPKDNMFPCWFALGPLLPMHGNLH
jgi:hypothetical protein